MFASAPDARATQLTRKVQRRFKSANDALTGYVVSADDFTSDDNMDGRELRRLIVSEVLKRLSSRGLSTEYVNESLLAWCLPSDGKLSSVWQDFLSDPLSCPEAEVRLIFSLQAVNKNTAYDDETTTYYLRTLAFSREELMDVLQEMLDEGYDYMDRLYSWLALLQHFDENATAFVRYAGQTTGSPLKRFSRDFHTSASSFGRQLMHVTADLYPEIVNNIVIQEFPRANITFLSDQRIKDFREQVLIALFGEGTLNVESGGVDFTWQPTEDDRDLFQQLKTDTVHRLRHFTIPCSDAKSAELRDWATRIQEYANSNPQSTGTARVPFSQQAEDAIFEEALCTMTANGMTAALTIASDKPQEWAEDPQPYCSYSGQAARVSQTILNHLASFESASRIVDTTLVEQLAREHRLSFTNVYPWTKKDAKDFDWTLKSLRSYIRTANPLVICAYGRLTTGVANAGFLQKFGISASDNLIDVVGSLHLVDYSEHKSNDTEQCAIVIPAIHPGSIGHSGTSSDLAARCFYLSQCVFWSAISDGLNHAGSSMSKKQICQAVIISVETKTGTKSAFGKHFEKVKAEFSLAWNEAHMRVRSQEERTKSQSERKERYSRRRNNPLFKPFNKQVSDSIGSGTADTAGSVTAADMQSEKPLQKRKMDQSKRPMSVQSRHNSWRRARDNLNFVLLCGFVVGPPGSTEREKWVATIDKKVIGAKKLNSFKASASSAKEHASAFLACADFDTLIKQIPDLLRTHLPEDVENPSGTEWTKKTLP